MKPFHPSDHIGPEVIIEEEVWVYVPPPSVVGSLDILPGLLDTMIGGLGDLQFSVSVSTSRNKEGNYLEH